jgi:polyphosphate kinase 2 (PPK2 family)
MLADDGTAIVKFFLHISKHEQKRRMKKLSANPLEAWRVTKEDRARHRKYDQYAAAVEEALAHTEAAHAKWTIVEATSRWWARRKIFDTVIAALERRLGKAAPPSAPARDDADLRAAMEELADA